MSSLSTKILGTVAMAPKGEYDETAYYEKLNTVLYNDSTYMAIKSSHGILPTDTEYWQLIGGGLTREDIVDNLNSNDSTKMLSAKQGKELKNIVDGKVNLQYGETTDRPTTNLETGEMFFDTTLTKPIWYDGSNWVDATGTTV